MPAADAEMRSRSNADARSVKGVTHLSKIDGRTRLGRRITELRSIFTEGLGGQVDAVTAVRIQTAAEALATAEQARGKYLRDEPNAPPLDDVVRIERVAAAAINALGLQTQRAPAGPSLDEYLADKYGSGARS